MATERLASVKESGNIRTAKEGTFLFGAAVCGFFIMVGLHCCSYLGGQHRSRPRKPRLGSFMTPIVNVLLGAFIFERSDSALAAEASFSCFWSLSLFLPLFGHPGIALGLLTTVRPIRID